MSVIDIMLIVLAIGTLVGVQVRNGRATVTARSKVIWSLGGWVIVLLVVVAIWVIAAVRF